MGQDNKLERQRLEDACRIYRTNEYAAQALGVLQHSFTRACKRYGIETPNQRHLRLYGKPIRSDL